MLLRRRIKRWFGSRDEAISISLAGLLVTFYFANLYKTFIIHYDASLLLVAGLALLFCIFYASNAKRRVEEGLAKLEARVSLVTEDYDERSADKWKGKIYKTMTDLVDRAEEEILVLSVQHLSHLPRVCEGDARKEYLSAIQERIEASSSKGSRFTYVRVFQYRGSTASFNLRQAIGPRAADHCRELLEKQSSFDSCINVAVKWTEARVAAPFVIFDHRWVAIELDGITAAHQEYAAGLLVIENEKGKIVEYFHDRFRELRDQAHLLSVEDFRDGATIQNLPRARVGGTPVPDGVELSQPQLGPR